MGNFEKEKTLDRNNIARASKETDVLTFTPVPAIENDHTPLY